MFFLHERVFVVENYPFPVNNRGIGNQQGVRSMQAFTIMGYTVTNADEARSVLVMTVLKGDSRVAEQCRAVIAKFDSRVQK